MNRTPLPPEITREPCDPCKAKLAKCERWLGILVRRLGGYVVIDDDDREARFTVRETPGIVELKT